MIFLIYVHNSKIMYIKNGWNIYVIKLIISNKSLANFIRCIDIIDVYVFFFLKID